MEPLSDLTTAFDDSFKRQAAIAHAMALYTQSLGALDSFLTGAHPAVIRHTKSAVAAMDTSSGLAPTRLLLQPLFAAIDRAAVLGQLGQAGAVRVPMANAIGVTPTTNATASWAGEAVAKPVSAAAFAALSLAPKKIICQCVLSEELLRVATETLNLIERMIVSATASALNTALLDAVAVSAARPAGLLNGLSGLTPSGDLANQVGQVLGATSGGAPERPVLVVDLQTALRLTALPGLRDYVKVIVSPAASGRLIAIDAAGVAFSDDGGRLDIGQPMLEMSDAPANPTVSGTVLLGTWQRNLAVVRVKRFVSWTARNAVAFLTLA